MPDISIQKLFLPCETSTTGQVLVKIITNNENGEILIGVGENDWILKNGVSLDQLRAKLEE